MLLTQVLAKLSCISEHSVLYLNNINSDECSVGSGTHNIIEPSDCQFPIIKDFVSFLLQISLVKQKSSAFRVCCERNFSSANFVQLNAQTVDVANRSSSCLFRFKNTDGD
jgi:hypothetical protein